MNHEELLAEYERLKEQAAQLQAENSQLPEQLKEAQLLIVQLKRELLRARKQGRRKQSDSDISLKKPQSSAKLLPCRRKYISRPIFVTAATR